MNDSLIKGTGNSRYLKSVDNFLTKYPTYDAFAAAMVAGTLPVDFNGINTAGWNQLGTALNKANLLKDPTAALFGMTASAVPDDVLAWVGKFNEHWWSLRDASGTITYAHSSNRSAYPDNGTVANIAYQYLGIPFQNFQAMPKIEMNSYIGTGTYGSANPKELVLNVEPVLLMVLPCDGLSAPAFMVAGSDRYYSNYGGGGASEGMIVQFGRTMRWHSLTSGDGAPRAALNLSGAVYVYIAIGY